MTFFDWRPLWTGRWTVGVTILVQIICFQNSQNKSAFSAVILSAFCMFFSAICKASLGHIQIQYLRATHKFDFMCLFMALWMDILTLLTSCAVLARVLSTCLNIMTGGMARIYILGRNSPDTEPWPDVLGVCVIILITGMFMLGLENTNIFRYLMTFAVLGTICMLVTMSALRGNIDKLLDKDALGIGGMNELLVSSASIAFSFPNDLPSNRKYKKLNGFILLIFFCVIYELLIGCLFLIMPYDMYQKTLSVVPIFTLLELLDFHKIIPAIACLLMLACSGALLELFPEMFYIIVKLTTSEWKILSKQIGYENTDSGSPVLAVFICGSLCAIFAFACPMDNLISILAATNLLSGIFRAFYLLYSPFCPKYIQNKQNDTNLAYSRLDSNSSNSNRIKPGGTSVVASASLASASAASASSSSSSSSSSSTKTNKQFPWKIRQSKCIQRVLSRTKFNLKKSIQKEKLEREWLLLDEPPGGSPKITTSMDVTTTTETTVTTTNCNDSGTTSGSGSVSGSGSIMTNTTNIDDEIEDFIMPNTTEQTNQTVNLDTKCIIHHSNGNPDIDTDSSSSSTTSSTTDVDAIVDEYRQKIKITMSSPIEKLLRVPTVQTWKITIFCVIIIISLNGLMTYSIMMTLPIVITIITIIVILLISLMMTIFIPKYMFTPTSPSALTCSTSLILHTILLIVTLSKSWGAIVFWFLAGLILLLRCDTWFCNCLDSPTRTSYNQYLIPNVESSTPIMHVSQLSQHSLNGGTRKNLQKRRHR